MKYHLEQLRWRSRGLLTWGFAVLAILLQIGSSFHRHAVVREHDECPVCVAAHQQSHAPSPICTKIVLPTGEIESVECNPGSNPHGELVTPSCARGPPALV